LPGGVRFRSCDRRNIYACFAGKKHSQYLFQLFFIC
jgi:hypothetical protein